MRGEYGGGEDRTHTGAGPSWSGTTGKIDVNVAVSYALDERLGVWVPVEMREAYGDGRRPVPSIYSSARPELD